MSPPILVLHQSAARLVVRLQAELPDEVFVAVDDLDAVDDALETHRPEVVFCIKTAGFIGPAFRALTTFESVRWTHVGGSGTEHLGAWDPRRVTVTHSAGVLAPFLAETWLGAVLALEGGLLQASAQADWQPRTHFRTVRGQRLLVVGLGEIGGRVAQLAQGLGMEVEGIRRHPDPTGMVPVSGLDDLDARLPTADVVSLHLRLTPELEGIFNAERFARMKPGALFTNTARGRLVDQSALVSALQSGRLRGAYLDVFEHEPLPETSPLWAMDNVLITPHAADQVEDWDLEFVDRFVALLRDHRAGRPLAHVAVPAASIPAPNRD